MSRKQSRSPESKDRTSKRQRLSSPKSSDNGSGPSTKDNHNVRADRGEELGEYKDLDHDSKDIDSIDANSDENVLESNSTESDIPGDPPSPTPSSEIRASNKIHDDKADAPYSKPITSPPLQLTFGVEIECVLVYREEWVEKHKTRRDFSEEPTMYQMIMEHVRHVLREASIPVTPYWTDNPTIGWFVDHDVSVTAFEKTDFRSTLPQGWNYVPLEIVSPKLKYSPNALKQVRRVLEILKRKFDDENAEEENFRWYVNNTCGLHIHVGAQRRVGTELTNNGFPFSVIKNLYTFGAYFQNQIHEIFPWRRINANFARAITRSLRSGGEGAHGVASRIEDCDDYKSLLEKSKRVPTWFDKSVAYNIVPLQGMDPGATIQTGYKTIEFRQHHGSIDPDEICNWARFVTGLVRLSHHAGGAGFPVTFLDRSREENFRFLDLLTCLNMDGLKEHYGKPGKLFEHPKGDMDGQYDWEFSSLSSEAVGS
jgi:hypothetical protein